MPKQFLISRTLKEPKILYALSKIFVPISILVGYNYIILLLTRRYDFRFVLFYLEFGMPAG